jgi:hypothetical protein
MDNIKVNLTMLVQGATIMSEQECSKQLRKPVINKKTGKQFTDKKGNLLWYNKTVPDFDKMDKHYVTLTSKNKGGKETKETYPIFTRRCKPAKKVLNICEDAYKYFIGDFVPESFRAPKSFVPKVSPNKIPISCQAWLSMSKEQRLEWHLHQICEDNQAALDTYHVYED